MFQELLENLRFQIFGHMLIGYEYFLRAIHANFQYLILG